MPTYAVLCICFLVLVVFVHVLCKRKISVQEADYKDLHSFSVLEAA